MIRTMLVAMMMLAVGLAFVPNAAAVETCTEEDTPTYTSKDCVVYETGGDICIDYHYTYYKASGNEYESCTRWIRT